METSRLLIDEQPLVVLPTLATLVGLEEAIILQQVHYWLRVSRNEKDGHTWVYNSYRQWGEQIPFMSRDAIGRAIRSLEKLGLLVVGDYGSGMNRTKWYRIDYVAVSNLGLHNASCKIAPPLCKNALPTCKNEPSAQIQNHICEAGTQITQETTQGTAVPLLNGSGPEVKSQKHIFGAYELVKSKMPEIFEEMRKHLGWQEESDPDPIPSYGKEGAAIKRMLARGFTPEQILRAWKEKVSARRQFVSMVFVNDDIGGKLKKTAGLPNAEDLEARAKELGIK